MSVDDIKIHLNSIYKSGRIQEGNAGLEDLLFKLLAALENIKKEKVHLFQVKTGLTFLPGKEPEGNVCYINNPEVRADYKFTFTPIDLLDYIYAVLHSRSFREEINDFPGNKFPWVPYPCSADSFWKLTELGRELRQIHLLESPKLGQPITYYPVIGNNLVDEIRFEIYVSILPFPGNDGPNELGRIHLNENQYFADVPRSTWDLSIGGIQPLKKWLSDRIGKILSDDDIGHYQKIIVALVETSLLIKEVDKIAID